MSVNKRSTDAIDDVPTCAVFKTAIGWCGVVMAQGTVRMLFTGYDGARRLTQHIRNALGNEMRLDRTDGMKTIIQKLRRFCSGEKVSLSDVPMDWSSLTPFQQKVLRAAAQIPYGSVDTYGGIARKIGSPRSARAVGNALGKNPFPLLVPCHRVIKGDGSIGGYSAPGGAKLKKRLLHAERREKAVRLGRSTTDNPQHI
jgi:methylated-DNA-[protein]-cysteine S-methyltransferase